MKISPLSSSFLQGAIEALDVSILSEALWVDEGRLSVSGVHPFPPSFSYEFWAVIGYYEPWRTRLNEQIGPSTYCVDRAELLPHPDSQVFACVGVQETECREFLTIIDAARV